MRQKADALLTKVVRAMAAACDLIVVIQCDANRLMLRCDRRLLL